MSPESLLSFTAHRPYPLNRKPWSYYQEWQNVIMLHWKIPFENLRPLVPGWLKIDTFSGEAWISLIAFTGKKFRPRYLPPVPAISNFHEVNVRTYVVVNDKPGIYFLSIEAQKTISSVLAGIITGLPYVRSKMIHETQHFVSENPKKNFSLEISYAPENLIGQKEALTNWLTERYCVYNETKNSRYRLEIHHLEWPLKDLKLNALKMDYHFGDLALKNARPDLLHFSDGLQVLAWAKSNLRTGE